MRKTKINNNYSYQLKEWNINVSKFTNLKNEFGSSTRIYINKQQIIQIEPEYKKNISKVLFHQKSNLLIKNFIKKRIILRFYNTTPLVCVDNNLPEDNSQYSLGIVPYQHPIKDQTEWYQEYNDPNNAGRLLPKDPFTGKAVEVIPTRLVPADFGDFPSRNFAEYLITHDKTFQKMDPNLQNHLLRLAYLIDNSTVTGPSGKNMIYSCRSHEDCSRLEDYLINYCPESYQIKH